MAEIYTGIKFELILKNKIIEDNFSLLELKKWCVFFSENNLAPPYPGGSSGNLSYRLNSVNNSFIITASRTSIAKNMKNSDFVEIEKCNLEQNQVFALGEREPSSETLLHHLIYKNKPEINAIFHGHSDEILSNTLKLNIPSTEKELPYGTVSVANSILEILDKSNFLILKNHGFIALGQTMEDAGNILIESLTKINLYTKNEK